MDVNAIKWRKAEHLQKTVTLQDIADRCALSKAIVGQVLRNYDGCRASPQTRARIQAAAEELGYQPDLLAKGISTGKSFLFGMLGNNSLGHMFTELVSGIQADAAKRGYSIVYYPPSTNYESELASIEQAARRKVDVLMIVPRDNGRNVADQLLKMHSGRVKVIQLLHSLHPGIPSITIDFKRVTYDATKHLINQGHTRILHVNYGPCVTGSVPETDSNWHKILGYRQAMEEANLKPAFKAVPEGQRTSLDSLYVNAGAMLGSDPTGVVVMNCSGAYGLMAGLKAINIRVPEDVSVVGCDDDYFVDPRFSQQLSAAKLDCEEMGGLATQMSFDLLNEKKVEDIVVCPAFRDRQSTGLPKK